MISSILALLLIVDTFWALIIVLPRNVSHKPSAFSKAYLLYNDAWWVTKLNQTEGEYPSGNGLVPI